MKYFGYISMTFATIFVTAIMLTHFFVPGAKELQLPLGFSQVLIIWMMFNMPMIKINTETIRIFTLNPFQKNTNIQFADVSKVIVTLDYKMRVVFQMKDGTYKSINTSRYSYDMKPFYYELAKSGVDIASDGADTIDWVK